MVEVHAALLCIDESRPQPLSTCSHITLISSVPSCRIDGMGSSKGADRPASRLQGLWRPVGEAIEHLYADAAAEPAAGGAAAAVKNPVLVYANVPVSVAFDHPFQQLGFRTMSRG